VRLLCIAGATETELLDERTDEEVFDWSEDFTIPGMRASLLLEHAEKRMQTASVDKMRLKGRRMGRRIHKNVQSDILIPQNLLERLPRRNSVFVLRAIPKDAFGPAHSPKESAEYGLQIFASVIARPLSLSFPECFEDP